MARKWIKKPGEFKMSGSGTQWNNGIPIKQT